MMDVFAVVMRVSGRTWIDTIWVVEESASERCCHLKERLDNAEIKPLVGCWVSQLKLEDAALHQNQ